MRDVIFNLRSKSSWSILALLVIFLIVRVINLDADLQPFTLMNYSAVDEFYYSLAPFNIVHYGSLVNKAIPYAELDSTPLVLTLNFFTTITLKLFGNNYFGLRLGSVLCSFVLFLFFISCIKRTSVLYSYTQTNNTSGYVIFIVLLFFALDYSFLSSGRISEPGISRSLLLVFLIWYMATYSHLVNKRPALFSFLLGFIAFFSVCFVYLYNVYFVAAAGLTLLLISYRDQKSWVAVIKSLLFFGLGAIVCCLLYEVFIRIFLGRSFMDFVPALTHYSDVRVTKTNNGFVSVLFKIRSAFLLDVNTNVFRLNLPFLAVFLMVLPVYIYRVLKERRNTDIFIACLLIFWFIQSYFENTYPLRRHSIMLPVFVLVVIYSLENIDAFIADLKVYKVRRIVYFLYAALCLYILFNVAKDFFADCSKDFLYLKRFEVLNIACACSAIALLASFLYGKKTDLKILTYTSLLFLIPACYLFFDRIVLNPTYRYKDAMVDIGKHVGNKIVAGGVSYSFRLYNEIQPALNSYAYMYTAKAEFKSRFMKLLDTSDYFIMTPDKINKNDDYSPMEVGYLNQISKETNYRFKLEELYNIGDRNILLIKKYNKELHQ